MRPLLSTESVKALSDETLKTTFDKLMKELIARIPGDAPGNAVTVWSLAIAECLLPLRGPKASCAFPFLALELVGHPKQRAVDHSAIIIGQVHDLGFDDEAPSSIRCRVRLRRSICQVRMS
jgi:hypothetical protein